MTKTKLAPNPYPHAKQATKCDFMRRRLDWAPVVALKHPIEWIGAEAFVTLDDTRRAIVTLDVNGVGEHYSRLTVRIVSKLTGAIDSKSFLFSAYLLGRVDDRVGGPNPYPERCPVLNQGFKGFEVVAYCGWDWYIAVPATTLPLMEAVAAYVRTFA